MNIQTHDVPERIQKALCILIRGFNDWQFVVSKVSILRGEPEYGEAKYNLPYYVQISCFDDFGAQQAQEFIKKTLNPDSLDYVGFKKSTFSFLLLRNHVLRLLSPAKAIDLTKENYQTVENIKKARKRLAIPSYNAQKKQKGVHINKNLVPGYIVVTFVGYDGSHHRLKQKFIEAIEDLGEECKNDNPDAHSFKVLVSSK